LQSRGGDELLEDLRVAGLGDGAPQHAQFVLPETADATRFHRQVKAERNVCVRGMRVLSAMIIPGKISWVNKFVVSRRNVQVLGSLTLRGRHLNVSLKDFEQVNVAATPMAMPPSFGSRFSFIPVPPPSRACLKVSADPAVEAASPLPLAVAESSSTSPCMFFAAEVGRGICPPAPLLPPLPPLLPMPPPKGRL
jgi:hypothetical protein